MPAVTSHPQSSYRSRNYSLNSYTLNLCDLQVMVGRATDNWKMAHTRSQSQLQVVEKFNISIKVERRLMFTTDPQWPSATLSGTIPSLAIHVNEPKVSLVFTSITIKINDAQVICPSFTLCDPIPVGCLCGEVESNRYTCHTSIEYNERTF